MMRITTNVLGLTLVAAALADDAMPEAQKMRYCERMRDFAVQAFHDRELGRPVKLFEEDGSRGPRIANTIARGIHADRGIASTRQAEAYARTTCLDMMGVAAAPPK